MTKPNRPANAQRIRRILILSYLVITLVAVAASSIPVLLLSSNALKNKVTSLLYTYTSQLVQNSDTYLSGYESQVLLYLLILPPCSTIPTTPLSPRRHET